MRAQHLVLEVAIDFVRGRKHQRWWLCELPQGFEQVQRTQGIDLEVLLRVEHTRGHSHLGGKVKHLRGLLHGLTYGGGLAYVRHTHPHTIPVLHAKPLHVLLHTGP
jgi:hypothetical protein